jgi:hypothetical protein
MSLFWITTALAWSPTEAEAAAVRAFSLRDASPPCAQIEADLPDPAASLEAIVDHVAMPPWAPMRAAACLVERHADARRVTLESWVGDPARKGLARLVFNRLHLLDTTTAELLAERALLGPLQSDARAAMLRSPSPSVQALATR